MIGVKLMGGLGNQMFQYAAARSLAIKHNVGVKLDLSFLNTNSKGQYTQRQFELDVFKIDAKLFSPIDIFFENVGKNISLLSPWKVYRENYFSYDTNFNQLPDKTYLIGWMQSEKYFSDIRSQILNEFQLKKPFDVSANDLLNKIQNTNSISIHIRRGDYVQNSNASSYHGVMPIEYYRQAIEIISSKVKDITVFCFSDDIEWCKANLNIQFPINYATFSATQHPAVELSLMSKCKHNIIANSSFSWWGAWLNTNNNKIIVAPQKWFRDSGINTKDLLPNSWIKI